MYQRYNGAEEVAVVVATAEETTKTETKPYGT